MQSIKESVVSALKTATALTTLVSTRIFFHHPNSFQTLPCVSYFEVDNAGEFFCDDTEVGSQILFQVDVWATGSTTAVAQAVDTVMVSEGFVRVGAKDIFEKETEIHHKSMLFVNHYADPNF